MSTFEVISKDGSFIGDSIEDTICSKEQIQQVLNGRENMYVILDEEITHSSSNFTFYVSDGSF